MDLLVRGAKTLSFALKDPAIQRVASQLLGKPVRVKFEVGESSNKAAAPLLRAPPVVKIRNCARGRCPTLA